MSTPLLTMRRLGRAELQVNGNKLFRRWAPRLLAPHPPPSALGACTREIPRRPASSSPRLRARRRAGSRRCRQPPRPPLLPMPPRIHCRPRPRSARAGRSPAQVVAKELCFRSLRSTTTRRLACPPQATSRPHATPWPPQGRGLTRGSSSSLRAPHRHLPWPRSISISSSRRQAAAAPASWQQPPPRQAAPTRFLLLLMELLRWQEEASLPRRATLFPVPRAVLVLGWCRFRSSSSSSRHSMRPLRQWLQRLRPLPFPPLRRRPRRGLSSLILTRRWPRSGARRASGQQEQQRAALPPPQEEEGCPRPAQCTGLCPWRTGS